jgi:Neocarzinostatin family
MNNQGEHMRLHKTRAAVLGVAFVAVLGACGSSSKPAAAPETTPTTAAPPSTAATTTTVPANPYKATATPTTGLTDGQAVTVKISGFKPGLQLGINECSTTTDDSGSGCDLGGITIITSAADGTGSATVHVKAGPFGADKVVCSALQEPEHCLLSVGELTADANAERSNDVPISFAG